MRYRIGEQFTRWAGTSTGKQSWYPPNIGGSGNQVWEKIPKPEAVPMKRNPALTPRMAAAATSLCHVATHTARPWSRQKSWGWWRISGTLRPRSLWSLISDIPSKKFKIVCCWTINIKSYNINTLDCFFKVGVHAFIIFDPCLDFQTYSLHHIYIYIPTNVLRDPSSFVLTTSFLNKRANIKQRSGNSRNHPLRPHLDLSETRMPTKKRFD